MLLNVRAWGCYSLLASLRIPPLLRWEVGNEEGLISCCCPLPCPDLRSRPWAGHRRLRRSCLRGLLLSQFSILRHSSREWGGRTFALLDLRHRRDVVLGVLEGGLLRGLSVRGRFGIGRAVMIGRRCENVRRQRYRERLPGPRWGRCLRIRLRCEACCVYVVKFEGRKVRIVVCVCVYVCVERELKSKRVCVRGTAKVPSLSSVRSR
jgi:hypothetical protein